MNHKALVQHHKKICTKSPRNREGTWGCKVRTRGRRTGRRQGRAQKGLLLPTHGRCSAMTVVQRRRRARGTKPTIVRTGIASTTLSWEPVLQARHCPAWTTWRWWSGPSLQDLCLLGDNFICDLLHQWQNLLQPIAKDGGHLIILIFFLQELKYAKRYICI